MLTKIKTIIMAKKSKKEEVVKKVSSVDKKIAKLKAVIKKLEESK
jgi:hypothetical protein